MLPLLQQALEEGLYGPKLVLPRIRHALLKISPASAGEFLNINTVDELKLAQKLARDG
jgi:molybdopterin-guanine dinucleotide biosynthesis protein A